MTVFVVNIIMFYVKCFMFYVLCKMSFKLFRLPWLQRYFITFINMLYLNEKNKTYFQISLSSYVTELTSCDH